MRTELCDGIKERKNIESKKTNIRKDERDTKQT
jgi:hypothetical protein